MKNFCLMPDQIQAVKNKLKEQGKEIIRMTPEERVVVFQDALKNGEIAVELNNKFQKAVESKRKGALTRWLNTYLVEEVKGKEETKKEMEKSMIGSIQKLFEKGILNEKIFDQFLEEIVRTKLGIKVTAEEVEQINKLVQEMNKIPKNGRIDSEDTIKYLEARKRIEDYIQSRSKSPFFNQLTGIFGRGNLLFSLPSMITNIISNTGMSILERAKRLVSENIIQSYMVNGRIYEGGANPELVSKFVVDAQKIYQKTGVDVTRIMSLQDEALTLGEKRSHATNRLFKFYEDVIFKQGLGAPDVVFSAFNYASNLNVTSTIAARKELALKGETSPQAIKQRAKELFQEASNLNANRSATAEMLREGATYAAQYATYQNDDRMLTKGLLKVREAVDEIIPQLNLGTNLDPFIKTPGNVFMSSLDYAGLTAPVSLATLWNEMKKADPDEVVIKRASDNLIRSGIGILVATAIAGALDDDDYIPDYTQATKKQRELVKIGNGVYYGVRIGDKWVSLVYFGASGITIAAIMQARRDKKLSQAETEAGKNLDALAGSTKSVYAASSQLPILNHFFQIAEFYGEEYTQTGDDKLAMMGRGVVDNLIARSTPAFFRTIGNITDPYQRQKDYTLPLDMAVEESFKANFPILREELTPRYDNFGNILLSKGFINNMFFGSRAAQSMNDPVLNEMTRLEQNGIPTIVTTTTYKPLKEAKLELLTPDYQRYLSEVQKRVKQKLDTLIASDIYQKQTDENKAIMLKNVRESAVKEVSKELGYQRYTKGWNPATKKLEK